jgi:hypothetical protein
MTDDGDDSETPPDESDKAQSLRTMLRFLAEHPVPQRVASRSLAEKFVLERKGAKRPATLRSVEDLKEMAAALGYQGHTSLYPANNKFGKLATRDLRNLYRIGEGSSCWVAFRTYKPQKFEDLYLEDQKEPIQSPAAHDIVLAPSPDVATTAAPAPRRIDQLLEEDKEYDRGQPPNTFASLPLWIGKTADEAGVVYLRPNLNCLDIPTGDGTVATIKEAHLKFQLGRAETVPPHERYGKAPFECGGATFTVRDTDARWPSWLMRAIDGRNIGQVFELPDGFIKVSRLADGDVVISDWPALNWNPGKGQEHWPANLMEDLAFCQTVLEDAVSNNAKFRLMIIA